MNAPLEFHSRMRRRRRASLGAPFVALAVVTIVTVAAVGWLIAGRPTW